MALSEDQRADIVSKYGAESVLYENDRHGVFVFVKPKRAVWQRFQRDVTRKDKDAGEAFDQLLRDCLVYPGDEKPDHAKLVSLLDDYPACSVDIGDKLAIAARGGEAVSAGKR